MAYIGKKPADVPITAADVPNLDTAKITTGTLDNARIALDAAEIPNISTDKLTSGTLADARIADLSASKLTGTIDNARITLDAAEIPSISTDKLTSGTIPDARLPSTALNSNVDLTTLSASNLTSGTVADARFPATLPATSGVNLTALNATNLGSGTVADARLPTTTVAKGGTNLTSFTAGDTLYATGSTTLAKLAKGTAAQQLAMNAGATAPEWITAGGGGAWTETADVDIGSTAVATADVTGCFSSSYTSYRMIITGLNIMTENYMIYFRWLVGSTALSAALYKGRARGQMFGTVSPGTHAVTGKRSSQNSMETGSLGGFVFFYPDPGWNWGGDGEPFNAIYDIQTNSSSHTKMHGFSVTQGTGDAATGDNSFLWDSYQIYQSAEAITGIQFLAEGSADIKNGNIKIYGLNA